MERDRYHTRTEWNPDPDWKEGDIKVEGRRNRGAGKDTRKGKEWDTKTHVEVMRYRDGRWYCNEEIQGRRNRGGGKELKGRRYRDERYKKGKREEDNWGAW
jgi:hypothetical protein